MLISVTFCSSKGLALTRARNRQDLAAVHSSLRWQERMIAVFRQVTRKEDCPSPHVSAASEAYTLLPSKKLSCLMALKSLLNPKFSWSLLRNQSEKWQMERMCHFILDELARLAHLWRLTPSSCVTCSEDPLPATFSEEGKKPSCKVDYAPVRHQPREPELHLVL